MQAALQQLLQSPGQVQRLMHLVSGSTNGSTSPTTPTQSGTWTPPISVDLPQLSQLALYDGGSGGSGSVGALTFDDEDTIGPSPSQLTEEEARLARTYHDAGDIDADVNALQANINALIENMGLDSAPLAGGALPLPHPHPPLSRSSAAGGGEETSSAPAGADFDFDAFLTAFASEHDVTVPLSLQAAGLGAGIGSAPVVDQPVAAVAGRKRTSDAAGLGLALPAPPSASPTPTSSPSRVGAIAEVYAAASADPPRVKRSKK
jgi:heat shock transcription factor